MPAAERELPLDPWVSAAQVLLVPLTKAVAGIEKALTEESVIDHGPVDGLASEVVAAIDALMEWLGRCEAPGPMRTAEGELAAAAGVYRNATSLFRSLQGADPEQRAARLSACSTMLSQGDHHVEVFASEVRSATGS